MTPIRISTLLTTLVLLAGCATAGRQASGPHEMHGSQRAQGPHGLVALKSPHSHAETVSRLLAQLAQRNLSVATRLDHAASARQVGQTLRPNDVVMFGNPQAGTPLMQCAATLGIDLPMKALIWTDGSGQVWLGYNDPAHLVHRHRVPECPAAENLGKALASIAEATVAR